MLKTSSLLLLLILNSNKVVHNFLNFLIAFSLFEPILTVLKRHQIITDRCNLERRRCLQTLSLNEVNHSRIYLLKSFSYAIHSTQELSHLLCLRLRTLFLIYPFSLNSYRLFIPFSLVLLFNDNFSFNSNWFISIKL